ncbi:uncharacterized protein JN550_005223 [Neoarthrinium moseri]|uniref:uncharacterized protein n=1 Tax=Neoarthrinium moseri TaxID=1658444 RepID=UPI001FDD6DD4|nr:uncharacterized protein JN550_005223 [Neoarthrinium moseri]KAI1870295.1 hypothetical protein JN550_005223 [Neoarthrinium moseri]
MVETALLVPELVLPQSWNAEGGSISNLKDEGQGPCEACGWDGTPNQLCEGFVNGTELPPISDRGSRETSQCISCQIALLGCEERSHSEGQAT